ncbi:hypothetical protein [Paenibacillus xylanexedens]|nr:hypothetical protein [Paenibacillus xylanexedens]RPK31304.1 hypothetical protein EDO6_01931 [Paenibacillus xylanexedens]
MVTQTDDLIYIDAGIEGVILPSGDKTKSEWGEEEITDHMVSDIPGKW